MTGTSAVSVKRAVMFWIVHGVVKEVAPETYRVLEHAEATSLNQSTSSKRSRGGTKLMVAITASAIESAPSNVQSTAEQAESEMQIYWYCLPPWNGILMTGHLLWGCSRIWGFYQWKGYNLCCRCLFHHLIRIIARKRSYGRSWLKKRKRGK